MKYIVYTDCPNKFDKLQDALSFAAGMCYMDNFTYDRAVKALEAGNLFRYGYGFTTIEIKAVV